MNKDCSSSSAIKGKEMKMEKNEQEKHEKKNEKKLSEEGEATLQGKGSSQENASKQPFPISQFNVFDEQCSGQNNLNKSTNKSGSQQVQNVTIFKIQRDKSDKRGDTQPTR